VCLQALVFTPDRRLALSFVQAVAELPFDWTLLDDAEQPPLLLARESYNLVVTDALTENGQEVVRHTRRSPLNTDAVIFAAGQDPSDPSALQLGADVALASDVNANALAHRIHEFMPLMKHERRWTRRCPVNIPVHLKIGIEYIPAKVLCLSGGGMMARVEPKISRSEVFSTNLRLPGTMIDLPLYGKIAWEGPDAKKGMRFLGVNEQQQQQLSDWLECQKHFA